MSAKTKTHPLNGAHTAGIFSDMSIDGPEIGTLVLVVDRAKNLPNRKTIGKQDPYCAARLGKEAKKTTTDIRGGQTPKWDQELRFSVHDSPDYFQLKVSVFSDDKKTELIGETWVDLRNIVVSGGGQSDQWHSLSFRGKYAGEIRIEITYYDSRPKPEKPVAPAVTPVHTSGAAASPSSAQVPTGAKGARPLPDIGGNGSLPRASLAGPKRRPLPSDPITGQAPLILPQQQQQPQPLPQPQPQLDSQPQSFQEPVPPQQQFYQQLPPAVTPSRPQDYIDDGYGNAPLAMYQHQHQPQQHPHRLNHHHAASSSQDRHDGHQMSYHGHDNFGAEYPDQATAAHHYQQQQQQQPPYDHVQPLSPLDLRGSGARYDDGPVPAAAFFFGETSLVSHMGDDDDPPPPPPPVHRSRHNSSGAVTANPGDTIYRQSPEPAALTMRHDVLRNEAHRHANSMAYPGRPTYRPVDGPSPSSPVGGPGQLHQQQPPSPPPQQSYDPAYEAAYDPAYDGPLEKAASPAPLNLMGNRQRNSSVVSSNHEYAPAAPSHHHHRQNQHSQLHYQHHHHQQSEPIVASSYARTPSPLPLDSRDYKRSASPQPMLQDEPVLSYQDGMYALPPVPPSLVPGVHPDLALELRSRIHSEEPFSLDQQQRRYTLPSHSSAAMATPPRGRQMNEGSGAFYGQNGSPQPFTPPSKYQQGGGTGGSARAYETPPPQHPRYDRSPGPHSSAATSPVGPPQSGGGGQLPKTQHTIKRKSVSPRPVSAASANGSERHLVGVPFGPDSYDALNPALAAVLDPVRPDYNEESGKIITHDGREVDPSDHLPVESWAPEPEPKPGVDAAASSAPSSGRKQLRIAGRPGAGPAVASQQTTLASGSSGISFSSADDPSMTYSPMAAGGRNRLQKKANRPSVVPVGSSPQQPPLPGSSSPLTPLMHSRQHDNFNYTPPRAVPAPPPRQPLHRASTMDFATENQMPSSAGGSLYSNGSGSSRLSFSGTTAAPPIPAKLPVGGGGSYRSGGGSTNGDHGPRMSGALPAPVTGSYGGGGGARVLPWDPRASGGSIGGGEVSLVEEISRIDIGTGRARRHQGRY